MTDSQRITHLEQEVVRLKASQGTVRLGIGWVSAVWTVVAGLVAAAFFIAQLAAAQVSLAKTVDTIQNRLEQHVTLPGHPAEVERVGALKDRLDHLQANGR